MERVRCIKCGAEHFEVDAVSGSLVLLTCAGCGARFDAGVSITRIQDCKEAKK